MPDELEDLVNKLQAGDQMLGWISGQVVSSYNNGDFFASFLGLCVLVEQAVRERADSVDGDYMKAIELLRDDGALNSKEFEILANLKIMQDQVSNTYMHAPSLAPRFANDPEDVVWTYNEATTWEEFMKLHLLTYMRIISRRSGFEDDHESY